MTNDTQDNHEHENPFRDVVDCMAHSGVYEDDCEFCQKEIEGKQKILGEHVANVNARIQKIAQDGGGVPAAEQIMAIKLDVLLDNILTPRSRLHFEMEVGMRVEQMVAAAAMALTRHKLTQGVNGMPNGPIDLSAIRKNKGKG